MELVSYVYNKPYFVIIMFLVRRNWVSFAGTEGVSGNQQQCLLNSTPMEAHL
jgi:hypothetical protein